MEILENRVRDFEILLMHFMSLPRKKKTYSISKMSIKRVKFSILGTTYGGYFVIFLPRFTEPNLARID